MGVRMSKDEYEAIAARLGRAPVVESSSKPEPPARARLRKEQAREKRERLELMLLNQVRAADLPEPERDKPVLKGSHDRVFGYGFRFDFVFRADRLLVEVHGLLHKREQAGGHQTHAGVSRDLQKLNMATVEGWRYLAVTREMIEDGRAIQWIEILLKGKTDGRSTPTER